MANMFICFLCAASFLTPTDKNRQVLLLLAKTSDGNQVEDMAIKM